MVNPAPTKQDSLNIEELIRQAKATLKGLKLKPQAEREKPK